MYTYISYIFVYDVHVYLVYVYIQKICSSIKFFQVLKLKNSKSKLTMQAK